MFTLNIFRFNLNLGICLTIVSLNFFSSSVPGYDEDDAAAERFFPDTPHHQLLLVPHDHNLLSPKDHSCLLEQTDLQHPGHSLTQPCRDHVILLHIVSNAQVKSSLTFLGFRKLVYHSVPFTHIVTSWSLP